MNRFFSGALLGFCFVLSLLTVTTASAQLSTADYVTESDYRIYHRDGTPATLDDIREALPAVDVVFVGELHNDPVSHFIEQRVLQGWFDAHGHAAALSLEMFARDVQYIVDEYLTGLISDSHFQQSSSPWSNYETDYRPLVEFAKANALAVIAANAPRRYANMVSRGGRSSLESLSDQARRYLAPQPYAAASQEYEAQWNQVMAAAMEAMRAAQEDQQEVAEGEADHAAMDHGEMDHAEMDHAGMDHGDAADQAATHEAPTTQPQHGGGSMLDAQALWDATMAWSIAEHMTRRPGAKVAHFVGGFHVESGTGTPEHLRQYRPGTRTLIISVQSVEDPSTFDLEAHTGLGDFVVLGDSDLAPTY
jgi:uncharacterized iron-regulated protein